MALFTRCEIACPICRGPFDWHKSYGLEIRCCGKVCYDEANWRLTLSNLGEEYRPRTPKSESEDTR